jgi:hypothetical protein
MATERQIAANRRNAKKSTGPRSVGGKQRASKNAFRHGLSKPLAGADFTREVEALARQIAEDANNPCATESARSAAEAQLELARVHYTKANLIERYAAFGCLVAPEPFRSRRHMLDWTLRWIRREMTWLRAPETPPHPPMPTDEGDRTVEAIRRALPALTKLARYESRAAARRDQAIRELGEDRCKT